MTDYKKMIELLIQQKKELIAQRDQLIKKYQQEQLECIEARQLARQYLNALHALDAAPEVVWLPWEVKNDA